MTTTLGIGKFAVIRRPLLPMATFDHWHASGNAEQYILDQYRDGLLEEGLYIANASLHARLDQIRAADPALHGNERRNAMVSLTKFLSRAAYRCTPFGLFAHIQLGRFDNAPAAATARRLRRGIHLDAAVEAALLDAALDERSLRAALAWQISTTASVIGASMSCVDWVVQPDGQRTYRSFEVEMHDALALLHTRARTPHPFAQLSGWIEQALEVTSDEAGEFLHALIERRLLVPALAPTAASGCTLAYLLHALPDHPATATLRAVGKQLRVLRRDAAEDCSLVEGYRALQAIVDSGLDATQRRHGALQVDTIDDAPAALDPAIGARVVAAAQLLAAHTARRRTALDDYKRLFRERFEEREVGLDYALHAELGVPFPVRGPLASPLLDGLRLAPQKMAEEGAPTLNAFDRLLIERLFDFSSGGQAQLSLSRADLARLPAMPPPPHLFAEGLYAHISVLPGGAIELHALDGRNGLEMLGRFCHLSEALTAAACDHHAAAIACSDVIYAEIVHHPQDRLLNILRRPRLGSHDIVIAGTSELPRERQLWPTDLTIALAGDRFILRERRSGRTVIPRLTSAHNYTAQQLGAYQFLCYLQDDDAAWVGFHWPHAVRELPRLPRVEVDGVIVARARWTLTKSDIDALNRSLVEGGLTQWREGLNLPRFITYDQGDNRLPIDLHNPASALMLLDEIIKLPGATVQECLALNLATAGGPTHNQEWVVPLKTPRSAPAAPIETGYSDTSREGPVQAAMGNWAYLRIYTGSGHADRVLRELVMPCMAGAMQSGAIDRWHVVRYQDSFEHLRLRCHSSDEGATLATVVQLQHRLEQSRADGLLWRVVSDHYIPEWARYGGPHAMAVCEELFCLDSQELGQLLAIEAAADDGAPPRWLSALASIDAYAQRLCPDPAAREAMLERLAANFLDEQAPGAARPQALVALGARFRDKRRDLERLDHDHGPLAAWQACLHEGAARRDALIAQLDLLLADAGAATRERVRHSLMHMHCNRLVPADPRRHEVVLYDFARRLERARQARRRAAAQHTAGVAS